MIECLDEVELASMIWHDLRDKLSSEDKDFLDEKCIDDEGSMGVEDFEDAELKRVLEIAQKHDLVYEIEESLLDC